MLLRGILERSGAWRRYAAAGCLVAMLAGPAGAQGSVEDGCWKARAEMAQSTDARALLLSLSLRTAEARTPYSQAFLAWTLALGAERYRSVDPTASQRLESAAENCLTGIGSWITGYGQMQTVHGEREPVWVRSQPEAVAQAVLAWTVLQKLRPNPTRLDVIQKFAEGLVLLHNPDPHKYPFRAHMSSAPGRPDCPGYAPILERVTAAAAPTPAEGEDPEAPLPSAVARPATPPPSAPTLREVGKAPGNMWIPERSRLVEALVAASQTLGDKNLLEEAQQEALGIWTHLVVSNKLPAYFAPSPQGKAEARTASVVIDQLLAVYKATQSPVYGALLGAARGWETSLTASTDADKAALRWIHSKVDLAPLRGFAGAVDAYPPVSYQVMQAEDGKAVQKAFDLIDVIYPGGYPGKMARVGRENMFWMRFDIDREDDYHFYMVSLKSKLDGGLVSVMMRIDGDKILTVPLGGATEPFVDIDFVDGPRRLRQGPHSFGIRYNGLLMTQPALLDCVLAWPVVERRCLKLDKGRRVLLLHNRSAQPAPATFQEVTSPDFHVDAVDGSGARATLERKVDKRRRKEYLILPPAGAAVVEWSEGDKSQ